jgi:anti-sigma factor RsiW
MAAQLVQATMSTLLRPWVATCDETMTRMSDHLDGELRPRTERRVLRHLARCERCRAMFASLQRTVERLRDLGTADEPASASVVDDVVARIRRERQ